MWNGNAEADAGAHGFFPLFQRSENSIAIFRFDLGARDQQIHQLNDGVPALGRLHFRDDLISGKKLSQRHADSSGAGSLSCGLRMTRSIWAWPQVVEKGSRDLDSGPTTWLEIGNAHAIAFARARLDTFILLRSTKRLAAGLPVIMTCAKGCNQIIESSIHGSPLHPRLDTTPPYHTANTPIFGRA